MTKLTFPALLGLGLLAALAMPAGAQYADIDYLGYSWEDGGFPPSNPGDVLELVVAADFCDPVFGVDLMMTELTFYAYGMVSTGEFDMGGGITMIAYTGGTLEIWMDPAKNADFGINPPNATVPSTFTDGTLFFEGAFTDFALFLAADGSGSFEGNLDGLDGMILSQVCAGCAYTWGGAFTPQSGAFVPEGYDLQIDGVFEIDISVPETEATWGSVKALYGE